MKKKIFFWLGNDYTHYCLAYALQRQYDYELYGIIEVSEKPTFFFKNQKIVNFKRKWFLHEHIKEKFSKPDIDYLTKFEEKYKIDLWKLIQNERIFLYFKNFHIYSPNEILNILEQECKFFEKIIEEIKPDFLFMKISSFHHQELFYEMCKNLGIKVQILNFAPIGKHCLITQELEKFDNNDEYNLIESKNRNFVELREYIHKNDLVKQLHEQILNPGNRLIDLVKSGIIFFFNLSSKNTKTHYTYYGRTKFKVLLYYLKEILLTKFRKFFIDKNLQTNLPVSENFVFFPLHVEMERSLLIAAPFYTNQIEIIKSIAKSLPINYKLYVKEHPGQIQRTWRSSSDYKQIMDIPNVVLLHPEVPNENIYKKCKLLITIAGSSGFEALFYGKPVITFSDMYYSILPSVRKFVSFDKLSDQIKISVSENIESSSLDRYVSLIDKNFINFNYADFIRKIKNEFFHDGTLLDVEINEDKMRKFLEVNIFLLQNLADEHVKKMTYLNNLEIKLNSSKDY